MTGVQTCALPILESYDEDLGEWVNAYTTVSVVAQTYGTTTDESGTASRPWFEAMVTGSDASYEHEEWHLYRGFLEPQDFAVRLDDGLAQLRVHLGAWGEVVMTFRSAPNAEPAAGFVWWDYKAPSDAHPQDHYYCLLAQTSGHAAAISGTMGGRRLRGWDDVGGLIAQAGVAVSEIDPPHPAVDAPFPLCRSL